MKLNELKLLLAQEGAKILQMRLPDGASIPLSFHITEVGKVEKTFIDCGGEQRKTVTCQLQAWTGQDEDHRIPSAKAAAILDKAAFLLPDGEVPVEIEYERETASQYTVESWEATSSALILQLGPKHTDCLAKEVCGVPATPASPAKTSCCGPTGCC